jgi:tyrosine-protein phosphatase SIW14
VRSATRAAALSAFSAVLALSSAVSAAELEARGVANFHKVDDHIFRGAQPTEEGIKSLAKLGVKMVIDLRGGEDHTLSEKGIVEAAGMRYLSVPMAGLSAPKDQQIAQVFEVLGNSAHWPVFVHCKRGADRTGTVVACYRITHDHWTAPKALAEARQHGMSWFEHAMREYVLHFQGLPTDASVIPIPGQQ